MKKYLLIVLVLVGCSDTQVQWVQGSNGSQDIFVYWVNDKPLECLSLNSRLSCNWEKHNKLFEKEEP